MMQRLAPECRIADTSWIKPGKVAWDWWNTCNLTGVDFKAGMNTPTYKKYIDFAAENQLEYIIIDEGWSGKESLMEDISPEINLEELVAYGNQKGIGIILWASWRNLTGGGDISLPWNKLSATTHKWESKVSKLTSSTATTNSPSLLPNNSQHVPPSITCCLTYTD